MKNMSFSKLAMLTSLIAIVGCGGGSTSTVDEQEVLSELSQDLKDSITFMFDEERLAHDLYLALYEYHLDQNDVNITQLYKIATNSESEHINAVDALAVTYDLNVTKYPDTEEPYYAPRVPGVYNVDIVQNLYNELYDKGIQSQRDALEVGCMVEVTDINDLEGYITLAQESNATDLEDLFIFLRTGSYNHYWGFDQGLISLGIADGCCSLGESYCHPEYPTK